MMKKFSRKIIPGILLFATLFIAIPFVSTCVSVAKVDEIVSDEVISEYWVIDRRHDITVNCYIEDEKIVATGKCWEGGVPKQNEKLILLKWNGEYKMLGTINRRFYVVC